MTDHATDTLGYAMRTTGTIHIPKPGDRVRIDAVFNSDKGKPRFEALVGKTVTVVPSPVSRPTGCIDVECEGLLYTVWAIVSPLPASELEVECPWADGTEDAWCKGHVGEPCTYATGESFGGHHGLRTMRFLSLTGQAPKDSRPVAAPSGEDGSRNVGSERGDSGTGRAAGGNFGDDPVRLHAPSTPAAPSGFPKCACGAEIRGYLVERDMCGDCLAHTNGKIRDLPLDARIREARDKLRHDLDRPLPKVVAAERIWPAGAGDEYEL